MGTIGLIEDEKRIARKKAVAAVLVFAIALVIAALVPSLAEAQASQTGLVHEGGAWHYYKKSGELLRSSWKTVDGHRYYFGADGDAAVGSVRIGRARWVFGSRGRLLTSRHGRVARVGSRVYLVGAEGHPAKRGWHYRGGRLYRVESPSGACMTSGAYDGIRFTPTGAAKDNAASRCKIAIHKKIARLCKSSWSRGHKLKRLFANCVSGRAFVPNKFPKKYGCKGWIQAHALATVNARGANCFGCACLFAMYAHELGYKNVVLHEIWHMHAYVTVGKKRWDNMAGHPSMSSAKAWKIKSWSSTSPETGYSTTTARKKFAKKNAKAAKKRTGLKKVKGSWYYYRSGKKVKNSWRKVKGHWYFLKKSGKAAVGPCKVTKSHKSIKKGTWCVFGAKAHLLSGKKTRVVSVRGVKYRVAKSGAASAGWSADHTMLYLKTGELATGVRLIGDKLYAFSSAGVYNGDLTEELRAAAVEEQDASGLLELLGKPSKTISGIANCSNIPGEAIVYRYAHIEVSVVKSSDGVRYLLSVSKR
jgi:glucan-binding YG repeat protein